MGFEQIEKEYPQGFEPIEKVGGLEVLRPVITPQELEQTADNEELSSLLNEMFSYCERYTEDVLGMDEHRRQKEWTRTYAEEREQMEKNRTMLHNATIDSINVFGRELAKAGKDVSWLSKLSRSRAAYAHFALLTTYSRFLRWKEEQEKSNDSDLE